MMTKITKSKTRKLPQRSFRWSNSKLEEFLRCRKLKEFSNSLGEFDG